MHIYEAVELNLFLLLFQDDEIAQLNMKMNTMADDFGDMLRVSIVVGNITIFVVSRAVFH